MNVLLTLQEGLYLPLHLQVATGFLFQVNLISLFKVTYKFSNSPSRINSDTLFPVGYTHKFVGTHKLNTRLRELWPIVQFTSHGTNTLLTVSVQVTSSKFITHINLYIHTGISKLSSVTASTNTASKARRKIVAKASRHHPPTFLLGHRLSSLQKVNNLRNRYKMKSDLKFSMLRENVKKNHWSPEICNFLYIFRRYWKRKFALIACISQLSH